MSSRRSARDATARPRLCTGMVVTDVTKHELVALDCHDRRWPPRDRGKRRTRRDRRHRPLAPASRHIGLKHYDERVTRSRACDRIREDFKLGHRPSRRSARARALRKTRAVRRSHWLPPSRARSPRAERAATWRPEGLPTLRAARAASVLGHFCRELESPVRCPQKLAPCPESNAERFQRVKIETGRTSWIYSGHPCRDDIAGSAMSGLRLYSNWIA